MIHHMTPAARGVLRAAVTMTPGLSEDNWQHAMTSMADDGGSVFVFDNADGRTLRASRNHDGTWYYQVTRWDAT